MTLLEVIVTGALFSIVLTMVAQALVAGQRTQSLLSHKIAVYRQASMALDQLVRDAQAGRVISNLQYSVGGSVVSFPSDFTQAKFEPPSPPTELLVSLRKEGLTPYSPSVPVRVGYWRNVADSTLRRTLYDGSTGAPLAGTDPSGKVLVRDVKDFDFKLAVNPSTSLNTFTARIRISTIAEPVSAEIALE